MGFDYVNGDEVTNNEHLAEAIDMTREGSVSPNGPHGYGEGEYPNDDMVKAMRDSCFFVALEELEKIDSASAESQEKIEEVIDLLESAWRSSLDRQAAAMAEAHEILQDVWVPPSE